RTALDVAAELIPWRGESIAADCHARPIGYPYALMMDFVRRLQPARLIRAIGFAVLAITFSSIPPAHAVESPRSKIDLSGTWKFFPAFKEIEVSHQFLQEPLGVDRTYDEDERDKNYGWIEPDFDAAKWWDIQVPGSWNTQFEDLWSYEGLGWYRKEIDIPSEWEGKRVVFRSDGANYRTVLYVNGEKVGAHKGGYTAFSFPIQDHLKFGETNSLAITVDNESNFDRVPMERHDWWVHGGLYRPVYLEVTNPLFIEDVDVATQVETDPVSVDLRILLGSLGKEDGPVELIASLLKEGKAVARIDKSATLKGDSIPLTLQVENPERWTPDNPFLYTLEIQLKKEGEEEASDIWSQRIGLRSIRVEGTQLLLNGEPFLVKGVNRYENYAETGMTSTPESLQRDIDLIKGLGANTVRCHYTYARETYEKLDEAGLFAVCEIPLYQWGRPGHSEKNLEAAKSQLTEMIDTLGNHPSVFMWSVSNETRTRPREEGEEHERLSEMVVRGNNELIALAHRLDPTRPVI
ncbi:MAG: beta galactosidase jelly roll domain-containing protein, partial [Candidatus Omnitrophica bacterium]|nr:beta galactosidase jelly roll domain-containing protein [Candidatus Omnitrophota bacterium]